MPGYEPRREWGIGHDGDPAGRAAGAPWVMGPPRSGVHSFRFLAARSTTALGGGATELHVRIRRRDGSVTPTYVYFFDRAEAGRRVYERMRASAHPFTDVLVPDVINAKVPYTRA